jgi:hypothetical protein
MKGKVVFFKDILVINKLIKNKMINILIFSTIK